MKQKTLILTIVLTMILSACGARATPTVNPIDIQNTAAAAAFTMVAETQTAFPTATLLPPTETFSPTPLPTNTPAPSPTFDPLSISPTAIPSSTSQPASSGQDPCNQPLTSWKVPTAKLIINNETKPKGTIDVLSMYVVTELEECGFLSSQSTGPVGYYTVTAYIGGKKNFVVSGGFRIGEGSTAIIIRNDTIVAKNGCYPNC